MERRRRVSRRSLGLVLLAVAYAQVSVGFIAAGGSSGLLEYGYAWVRTAWSNAEVGVGVTFVLAALLMITTAIWRHWDETKAAVGYGVAMFPITLHFVFCLVAVVIGDLHPVEAQAAIGSQIGLMAILLLLHDWPDPLDPLPGPPPAVAQGGDHS